MCPIKDLQIEHPFTDADKTKLDTVEPGAQPQPAIATQEEAEAGVDNVKMMTSLRVSQYVAIHGGGSEASSVLKGSYQNLTGSTIFGITPVSQDEDGNMIPVDPSAEEEVKSILGITLADIATGSFGDVGFEGIIKNVTIAFAIDSIIYLSKAGVPTITIPEIGVGGFVAGNWVVELGKITKNSTNPSSKDFKINIKVIGQL